MQEIFIEVLLEVGSLVAYFAVFGALTALGLIAEYSGIIRVAAGETIGYWFLLMGLVAIVAGVKFGRDRAFPRLRQVLGNGVER